LLYSRIAVFSLTACLLGFAAGLASANTVVYDFTYAGTGTYETESVNGNGTFTVTFTPGSSTGTLDDFTFSDDFTANGASMFSYSSATGSVLFSTLSPYALTNVDLTTPYVTGTNAAYGKVDFNLSYSGVTFDSTSGSNASASDYLDDFSSGGGTITLVSSSSSSAVPEPTNGVLAALAVLAMLAFYRSRRRASVL
jgi:MYXO-CTERM domain-containing protein